MSLSSHATTATTGSVAGIAMAARADAEDAAAAAAAVAMTGKGVGKTAMEPGPSQEKKRGIHGCRRSPSVSSTKP
jgi:hypothetical protein